MRTAKTAAPAPNGSTAGLLGEAAVAITVGLGEGGRSLGEDLGECLEAFFVIGAFKQQKSPNLSSLRCVSQTNFALCVELEPLGAQ